MAVLMNKEGQVVTISEEKGINAIDQLKLKREAIYDAITQHDSDGYLGNHDMYYGLVQILRDSEPSFEQYQKMFNNPH